MVVSAAFVFGPDGSYLIKSPRFTRWNGLPKRINDDLQSGYIAQVIHMALGDGGKYLVSFKKKNGGCAFYHSGLPANLATWLDTKDKKGFSVFNVEKLRLSLGPDNSWYCHDGHNFWGSNLPSGLSTALEKMKKRPGQFDINPRIVALGPDGTYVMVNARNGGSWNVKRVSERLDQQLHALNDFKMVQDIVLDNYNSGPFVLHLSNGYNSVLDWQVRPGMGDEMREADAEIKTAGQRALASRNKQRSNVAGGLKLGAALLGALAGAGGSAGGGGGGAGGFSGNFGGGPAFDMSSFWAPIQDAAQAPIQ